MGNAESSSPSSDDHVSNKKPQVNELYLGTFSYSAETPSPPGSNALMQAGMPCAPLMFFSSIANRLNRNLILLVDCSTMLRGGLWQRMCNTVGEIVEVATAKAGCGVDVIFFHHSVKEFKDVQGRQFVTDLITSKEVDLGAGRDLAAALHASFSTHFASNRGATSVLVLTVGVPDSVENTVAVLQKAMLSVRTSSELSVSMMQLGGDDATRDMMKKLDDLKGRFDLVDAIHRDHTNGDTDTFSSIIHGSLVDPQEATKRLIETVSATNTRRLTQIGYFNEKPLATPSLVFVGYQQEHV